MAVLTAAARKKLKSSSFALPGGRYPIEDAAHARAALSRGAHNASPQEMATIRKKVHAKYPGMDVAGMDKKKMGADMNKRMRGH